MRNGGGRIERDRRGGWRWGRGRRLGARRGGRRNPLGSNGLRLLRGGRLRRLCRSLCRRKIPQRGLRFEPVRCQYSRGSAFAVLGDGNERNRAVDLPPSSAYGVVGRASEKRVELVAEARWPPGRIDQGQHPVVHGVRGGALDDGDVGANRPEQRERVRIVHQRKQEMFQRNIAVRALLGRRARAPQRIFHISGARQFRVLC